MPGAKLKVSEGAKLYATDLIAYSSYNGSQVSMAGTPYPVKDPGTIIVNGELETTNLAGLVLTEVTGAKLIVSQSGEIIANEPKTYSGSSFMTSIDSWLEVKETLKLQLYNAGNTPKRSSEGNYMSLDGTWYSEKCSIYYDAHGGELTGSASEGKYDTGLNGYLIDKINTSDPTREHYIFDGWYLDDACTIEAIGERIYSNTYVFAKWVPVEYYIKYEIFNETGDSFEFNLDSTRITIESIINLVSPENGSYVFDGWYIDSEKTIRISQSANIPLYAVA